MYDATLSLTIPASLYDIACAVARSLDPDTGGQHSWGAYDPDATEYSTSTPCTSEFAAQAAYMLTNPQALFAAVSQDYAARWADMTPPTLAECEAFCSAVIPVIPSTDSTPKEG